MGNNTAKPPSISELQTRIRDCVDSNGRVDYTQLNEVRRKWRLSKCDIAIVGNSGSGKSTLINNLLGVPRKNDEAEIAQIKDEIANCDHTNRDTCMHTYAPTSSWECTTHVVPYSFEGKTKVYLWDMPGYGAERYPSAKDYWKKFDVEKYDAFLVVSRDNRRIKEDREVIKYLLAKGKQERMIWVRTYFDAAMSGREKEDEAKERASARNFIRGYGIDTEIKVHCVSGLYRPESTSREHLYDLEDLKASIIQTVPEHLQMKLVKRFSGFSAELINTKFEVLQRWTALRTAISIGARATLGTALFIPGAVVAVTMDLYALRTFHTQAIRVYGFSNGGELLQKLGLCKEKRKFAKNTIQFESEMLEGIGKVLIGETVSGIVEFGISVFVPLVGPSIAAVVSGASMAWACHTINCTFRELALRVITVIDVLAQSG